VCVYKSNVADN